MSAECRHRIDRFRATSALFNRFGCGEGEKRVEGAMALIAQPAASFQPGLHVLLFLLAQRPTELACNVGHGAAALGIGS